MLKTIKLTQNGRLIDNKPFVLPDTLSFDFDSVGYDLTEAVITLKNGERTGKFKLTRPFHVPTEFLFDGYLNIAVDSFYKGKPVKSWKILPIRIKEVETEIECFDVITALEKKCADLENRVKELEEQHEIIM